jgi:hypothetical protein
MMWGRYPHIDTSHPYPITKTEKEDVKNLTKIEAVLFGGTKDERKK